MTNVTRDEFERAVDDLKATVSRGFDEIIARLDRMNGTQREHSQRLSVIETKAGRVDVPTLLAAMGVLVSIAAAYAAFH